MATKLDDLMWVLLEAEENGRQGIGLGVNEIHPLVYRLNRETNGELFDDITFRYGYRGVTSPEIKECLSWWEDYNEEWGYKYEDEDPVTASDEYYWLSKEKDKEVVSKRFMAG